MGGVTGSTQHTINEDERTEFTRHINAVLAGDADIGDRLPFPIDTFQVRQSIAPADVANLYRCLMSAKMAWCWLSLSMTPCPTQLMSEY